MLEQRHRQQFAGHLVMGGEWFAIAQPIIDHVNALRHASNQQPLRVV